MEPLRRNYKKLISTVQARGLISSLLFIVLFDYLLFPAPILASEEVTITVLEQNEVTGEITEEEFTEEIDDYAYLDDIINHLPANINLPVVKSAGYHVLTAYNSEVAQCDASPCITANGFNVCKHGIEDTVAANFLRFGTKVRIPALFGDRIFIVRDRMNARYTDRMDIWMKEKIDARKFGVKIAKIEIVK